jgi:hypothetical protein
LSTGSFNPPLERCAENIHVPGLAAVSNRMPWRFPTQFAAHGLQFVPRQISIPKVIGYSGDTTADIKFILCRRCASAFRL